MIGWLKGEVLSTGADNVLINVNGVGYVALAGPGLLAKLAPGKEAELHIETRVTENSITMFAFESDEARAWFVRLTDVPGVGGKVALAVLDVLKPGELMDAVALGDAASITRAKGVGKKMAERIVGELAGKAPPMGRFGTLPGVAHAGEKKPEAAPASGARSEAVSALVNLGYQQTDAARAVAAAAQTVDAENVSALIKGALKELSA
ncbi:MAG: Holliday junction branch migration protein RuvA [Ponticaulis sp.]|nr:Holliday junction branch migration protein RuvA [Ponticaulis sp.]